MALPKTATGRIYDPVFLLMLLAVVLAVGSSFLLRSVVRGLGPAKAHAADTYSHEYPTTRPTHTAPAPPIEMNE